MKNPTEETIGFLCQATHLLHFHCAGQDHSAFLPCNESLQGTGDGNLHELIPGTNCLSCERSLDADIATRLEGKESEILRN